MRSRLGRRFVASGITLSVVAAAMIVSAAPAGAQTSKGYVCSLSGTTTQLTPIPAPPKTNTSGTFAFSGTANCSGKKYGTSASGSYKNTICGTGSASGTATFSGGPNPINFSISFVGGQGTLTVKGGGSGGGVVSITPANSGGCVNKPVTGFKVTAVTTIIQ